MGFIPENTCRRCGTKYPGMRTRCPKCGAPRTNQPTRVPPTTASVTPDTAAYDRAANNMRWQFIFGGILLVALILAVVVLILTGTGGDKGSTANPGSQGATVPGDPVTIVGDINLPSPSPSPEPTPEASPTPPITSMAITFLNDTKSDITVSNPGELVVDLDCAIFPNVEGLTVKWSSSNETVLTVDQSGTFTIVGALPGQVIHATVIAECAGLKASCIVYVPGSQATYLTENLYDPEYVDEWDAEQARLAWEAANATIAPVASQAPTA